MTGDGKVYIILVNYKQWLDTIECIESILKNNYRDYQVVVIENNSSNHSIQRLISWAEGKEIPSYNPPEKIKQHSLPLSPKPIPYILYTSEEAQAGGSPNAEKDLEESMLHQVNRQLKYPLILIQNNKNIGFASANNIGMKYAMKKKDMAYVWLLNNDTTIETSALQYLVEKAKADSLNGKRTGLTGSKIFFYHQPEIIQAVGGAFNPYTAQNRHKGTGEADKGQYDMDNLKLDYVYGASMFMRKEFLENIGFMNEIFYLYMEELDWCTRAKRKGWESGFAYKSCIYHKQGVATGKKVTAKKRSPFMACLKFRNLIYFYQYHYPYLLPVAYFRLVIKSFISLTQGLSKESLLIWKIIFGKTNCEYEMEEKDNSLK